MNLLIVNPGEKGRPVRRRKRKTPARKKRTLGKSKKETPMARRIRVKRRMRKNPMKRRKSLRMRRRNPVSGTVKVGEFYPGMREVHTKKKTATKKKSATKKKTATKKKSASKSKRRGRKYTKSGALAKARRARKVTGKYTRSAKAILRRSKSKQKRGVANAYIRARSVAQRAKKGYLTGENAALARSYGLTRINPSIKGAVRDAKAMLPMIGVATAAVVGAAAAGMKVGGMLTTKLPATTPAIIRRNAVPLATAALTILAYGVLKSGKSKAQKLAAPVMFGGAAATGIHLLMFSEIGQKVAAALGLPLTVMNPMATKAAAEAAAKGETPKAGLASYIAVSQYLGDYVNAGPQEAFGSYVASDFPVHTPGPGDNMSVHASLGSYAGDTEIGPGASYYGRSDLGEWMDDALPIDEIGLQETPGGTMITSASLSGGLFSGSSAI